MAAIKATFDQVAQQHEEIHGIVAEIRLFLETPRPDVGEKGAHSWSTNLSEHLLLLHDKLYRHFRDEERTGFLGELNRAFPRASRAIDALCKEHDWILRNLGSLLSASICYSAGRAPENPQLRRWALSLVEHLERHEREETDLYQRLQYEDLGVGD